MRLGVVILPELHLPALQAAWRRAEELGFDHAWTYDHMEWRSLHASTWFAAIPTLTAAALATERIRIGTLVASPNFRHPVPFAKELMTLDDLSRGRLTLGIGAGSLTFDAKVLGEPAWSKRERADRFEEFVALTDQLLREPVSSRSGRFYSAQDAHMSPGCVQRPRVPFAIAAEGPLGMRVVAEHARTWVTNGDRASDELLAPREGAERVRAQAARVDDACAERGRDPKTLGRLVLGDLRLDSGLASPDAFSETIGRYADVGVTDFVVHWPRPDGPFAVDQATFERVVSDALQAR